MVGSHAPSKESWASKRSHLPWWQQRLLQYVKPRGIKGLQTAVRFTIAYLFHLLSTYFMIFSTAIFICDSLQVNPVELKLFPTGMTRKGLVAKLQKLHQLSVVLLLWMTYHQNLGHPMSPLSHLPVGPEPKQPTTSSKSLLYRSLKAYNLRKTRNKQETIKQTNKHIIHLHYIIEVKTWKDRTVTHELQRVSR